MPPEADTLLTAALKSATLRGSFCPATVGAKVGLDKFRALAAARWLANAGVLVLGFDSSAEFSPEYRKAQSPPEPVVVAKPKRKIRPSAKSLTAKESHRG